MQLPADMKLSYYGGLEEPEERQSLACTSCYLRGRRSLHSQDLKEHDDSCRHMKTAAKVEKSRDFVRHLEALKE